MNNSDNIKENILSIIYNYFPKNIPDSNELYWETKEFLNLKKKCEEISESSSSWDNFFDRLKMHFPYYLIIDKTQYFDFDRGHSLVITFKNELNNIKYFEIFVSYIAPCYVISLTENNGKGDVKYNIDPINKLKLDEKTAFDLTIIERTLLEFFPYQKIDESIGETILDDIAFQNIRFGNATIYKTLFVNNIFMKFHF
jgi:hypothetical protein